MLPFLCRSDTVSLIASAEGQTRPGPFVTVRLHYAPGRYFGLKKNNEKKRKEGAKGQGTRKYRVNGHT